MKEANAQAHTLLEAPDAGDALFGFLEEIVGRQQLDRRMFDAIADTWLANDEIRAAHAEIVGGLEDLLTRAKEAGAVRTDVGAMDVLMLLKGVCETAVQFQDLDPQISERHLDLVRAALAPPATPQKLRGRSATLSDLERVFGAEEPSAQAGEPPAAA